MPFMAAGYAAGRNESVWRKILDRPMAKPVLVAVLALATFGLEWLSYQIAGYGLWMFYGLYGMPLCTYGAALTGTACVCIISRMLTIRPICYLGANTLVYFGWHQSIMIYLATRLLNELGFYLLDRSRTYSRFPFTLVSRSVLVAVLTLCNVILTKTKLRVLLGKR